MQTGCQEQLLGGTAALSWQVWSHWTPAARKTVKRRQGSHDSCAELRQPQARTWSSKCCQTRAKLFQQASLVLVPMLHAQ